MLDFRMIEGIHQHIKIVRSNGCGEGSLREVPDNFPGVQPVNGMRRFQVTPALVEECLDVFQIDDFVVVSGACHQSAASLASSACCKSLAIANRAWSSFDRAAVYAVMQ